MLLLGILINLWFLVPGQYGAPRNCPGQNAEIDRNRKGWFSVNCQMICSANLKITDVVARWPGSAHDSNIFNNSLIRAKLENGEFALPCPRNEVWDDCVNWNKYCNPHCPLQFEPKIGCTNTCSVGCTCKPGYIRDLDTDQCIDDRFCPAPGDENSHFSRCNGNEQVYCWNCRDQSFSSDDINKQNCVCIPGYVCKPGYAKNAAGYCVPYEACDNISVPPVGAEE